jgi:signal transduction histidine kinase
MPEEVLAHIFEPLFSTKGFGVGLGMPTVKQIMEQHGGGIAVRSQTGQGTQVILWLPDITATPRPGTLQEEGE